MQMAGKIIRQVCSFYFRHVVNIVHKCKGPGAEYSFMHDNPCFPIPFRPQDIMISQYQPNGQIRKIISPSQKQIQLFIFTAMKKIAHNQQLLRLKILDQR